MDENDKPDGSTAMERLARELMDAVVPDVRGEVRVARLQGGRGGR